MIRLGLANAVGRPILIAQCKQEVVSMARTPLPNDPPAILLNTSLRRRRVDGGTLGDAGPRHAQAGAGFARKSALFRENGNVCEIEVEGIGLPRCSIVDERAA